MSTAPYDKFLRALRDGDTEAAKLKKLLASYPSLRGGFVTVRKDDGEDEDRLREEEDAAAREEEQEEADEEADEEEDARRSTFDDGGDDNFGKDHHASRVANLLVEAAEGRLTRPAALRWLIHHRDGNALLHRLRKREVTPMPDSLSKIIDDHGLINVAKSIASGGSTGGATEHSLTAAIEVLAKRLYPTLSSAQAFATFFSANTPESLACRQGIQKLKHHPVAEAAPRAAASGGTALAELKVKADALRKLDSNLTEAQAFARVYSAPENIDIVKRERAENRPTRGVT